MILNPLPAQRGASSFGLLAADLPAEAAAPPLRSAVVLATALAYALVSTLWLLLSGSAATVSPLNPCAGLALAAVVTFGRVALLGVAQGALMVQVGWAVWTGAEAQPLADLLPLAIAAAVTLQAGLGAVLLRVRSGLRWRPNPSLTAPQPLQLHSSQDLLRASLWGGMMPCAMGAGCITVALWALGPHTLGSAVQQGLLWWAGNTLAVCIATPIALAFLARAQPPWRCRRRPLALPLLTALLVFSATLAQHKRTEEERAAAAFEQQAAALAGELVVRLNAVMHAFQAVHGALRALPADRAPNSETLWQATQWWWTQAVGLDAVALALPEGSSADKADDGSAQESPLVQTVVRHRVPASDANRTALISAAVTPPLVPPTIPPAMPKEAAANPLPTRLDEGASNRTLAALQRARRAGDAVMLPDALPALGQIVDSSTGRSAILAQALYRGAAANDATRQALFSGYLLMSVDLQQALAGLEHSAASPLPWCLFESNNLAADAGAPGGQRNAAAPSLLAGTSGCRAAPAAATVATSDRIWQKPLHWADRSLQLQVGASPGPLGSMAADGVPGALLHASQASGPSTWLLEALAGLGLAALCALLLNLTRDGAAAKLDSPKGRTLATTESGTPADPPLAVAVAATKAAAADVQPPAAGIQATAPAAPPQRLRVHCIDDQAEHIELVRAGLREIGPTDLSVSALGLDGWTAIRKQAPDLLLLGHDLPDIRALELLRHLKSDPVLAQIPVIVLSSGAAGHLGEQVAALGAQHFAFNATAALGMSDQVVSTLSQRVLIFAELLAQAADHRPHEHRQLLSPATA